MSSKLNYTVGLGVTRSALLFAPTFRQTAQEWLGKQSGIAVSPQAHALPGMP